MGSLQSVLLGALGTKAHKTIMKAIIETNLAITTKSADRTHMNLVAKKHLQWLQTFDSMVLSDSPRYEGYQCTASLTEARNPADGGGEDPARKDTRRLVHGDRIHRTEKHPYNGDGHSVADEGGDKPNNDL